jgi:hypothetical protein
MIKGFRGSGSIGETRKVYTTQSRYECKNIIKFADKENGHDKF